MSSNTLKTIDHRTSGIFEIAYPSIIASLIIIGYSAKFSIHFIQVCYLLLLAGLPFALIRKRRSLVIQNQRSPKYSAIKWFSLIVLAQVAQIVIFLGMSQGISNTIVELSPPNTQLNLQNTFLSHPYWLLLSWLAAFTILNYFSPVKNSNTRIFPVANLFYPESTKKRLPKYVVSTYFSFRMNILLSFSIPLVVLLVEFTKHLIGLLNFSIAISQPLLVTFLLLIVRPVMLNRSVRNQGKKFWRKNPNIGRITILLIPFLVILLFTYNLLLTHSGLMTLPDSYPRILDSQYSINHWNISFFNVFAWAWWLACSPLLFFYLLRISEGRTLWQVFLGTITTPIVILILSHSFVYEKSIALNSGLISIIGIATIMAYVWYCDDLKNLLLSATLYKTPSKEHALLPFLGRSWVFNIIVSLLTYMTWGMSLLMSTLSGFACAWVLLSCIGVFRPMKKTRSLEDDLITTDTP